MRSRERTAKLGRSTETTFLVEAAKLEKVNCHSYAPKSLEHLNLTDCRSLGRLPADQLSGLEQLESVYISGCTLIDRSALSTLPNVKIQWSDSETELRCMRNKPSRGHYNRLISQ